MDALVLSLWGITKGAWIVAGLIILVRILFKSVLTPKAKYYLWLLLVFRLMMPVLPESNFSLMNYLPEASKPQIAVVETDFREIDLTEGNVPISLETAEMQSIREEVPDAREPEGGSGGDRSILFRIWVSGMAVTGAAYIALYAVTAWQLQQCADCRDEETIVRYRILRSKLGIRGKVRLAVGSGGMFGGLLRPTIVLPAEVYGAGAEPVLIHELTHYRYGDGWIYLIMRLLTVIHWYNPVVWLCFHFARLDSEAACDQRVLDSGLVTVRDYIRVLSEQGLMESYRPALMATSFAATEKRYMKRLRSIARYSGKRPWIIPVVILVVLGICALGLTSARSKTNSEPQETIILEADGYSSMTEVDGVLYLVDLSGNIVTMDWDTGETETFFRSLGVVEWCSDQTLSYLYYMDGESLCRVSTKTRETETLCRLPGFVKILAATEKGLFYSREDGYYAMNLATKASVFMHEMGNVYLTYIPGSDDSLYVGLNYNIYQDNLERWDLTTGEKTVLLQRDNNIHVVTGGSVPGNTVYFYIGSVLYSMSADGSGKPMEIPGSFNAGYNGIHCSDNSLFFHVQSPDDYILHRYDPVTGETEELPEPENCAANYAAISGNRCALLSYHHGEGTLVITDLPE